MQSCFDEVKKNFGFGCMRLPMKGKEVDFEETSKMVDMFLTNGFNYFDTAHGYLDGQSEIALKKCLTSRYPGKLTSLPTSCPATTLRKTRTSVPSSRSSWKPAA